MSVFSPKDKFEILTKIRIDTKTIVKVEETNYSLENEGTENKILIIQKFNFTKYLITYPEIGLL